MTIYTLYQQNGEYNSVDDRQVFRGFAGYNADGTLRGGVLDGLGVAVQGLTLQVKPGAALTTLSGNVYMVTVSAQEGVDSDAPDQTQDRVDLLVLQTRDQEVSGGLDNSVVTIIKGTLGIASPPVLPDGCLLLATVTLTHGTVGPSLNTDGRLSARAGRKPSPWRQNRQGDEQQNFPVRSWNLIMGDQLAASAGGFMAQYMPAGRYSVRYRIGCWLAGGTVSDGVVGWVRVYVGATSVWNEGLSITVGHDGQEDPADYWGGAIRGYNGDGNFHWAGGVMHLFMVTFCDVDPVRGFLAGISAPHTYINVECNELD